MFQLHDRTRRRICVAAFLAIGVVPMAYVAGWCVSRNSAGRLQAEVQELGRRLGMDVRLQGIQYLRPGRVLYERLEIADPETGQVLLKCAGLEVASHPSDQPDQNRRVLEIAASQPEIDAAGIGRLWKLLRRTIEGHHGRLDADVRLTANDLTLRAAIGSQTLSNVEGSLETLPSETLAQVTFQLAGNETSAPICMRFVRNRHDTPSPPTNSFEIDTGAAELPCHVLAMGFDDIKALGEQSRFNGCLRANETADGWEGDICGKILAIDLDRLVSDHFPHHLSGMADVTFIDPAKFDRGRLNEANIMFSAGSGVIGRSLIDRAVSDCGLILLAEPRDTSEHVRYGHLAFLLTFNREGATLQGCYDSVPANGNEIPPDTILVDGSGRALGTLHRHTQPLLAWLQMLVPRNEKLTALSRPTVWLLSHLRLPQGASATADDLTAPRAQTRLLGVRTE